MKLTLEFDNEIAAHRFMGWWLDGGGEQEANFNTSAWSEKRGYMRIEGDGTFEEEED